MSFSHFRNIFLNANYVEKIPLGFKEHGDAFQVT